jgi:predicted O-methyltransferase YrrM
MRYDQILKVIDLVKPKTIVEIGTWSGDNAIRMIRQASQHQSKITYIGYDLFEEATAETDAVEFNVKHHNNVNDIRKKILHYCPNAEVNLIKGNTRETLLSHPPVADFAYIDGGHSIDTIAMDYRACRNIPVIIFDDYYIQDEKGFPDTNLVGCNQLIDSMNGCFILPESDPIKGGGLTKLVLKI